MFRGACPEQSRRAQHDSAIYGTSSSPYVRGFGVGEMGKAILRLAGPITRRFRAGLRRGKAIDQDHVCPRRALPHFAWLAIFFTVQPVFGMLR